jgi:hypothetical protein
MIADNDLAMGRVVKRLNSPYLKDPRSSSSRTMPRAADHGLAPFGGAGGEPVREARLRGPYVLFHVGDAAIDGADFGLPPMSTYDAAATPMFNAFQATPDLSIYRRSTPTSRLTRRTRRRPPAPPRAR